MENRDKMTPEGTRDLLFEEFLGQRKLEDALTALFKRHGFCGVSTPAVEFFDVFSGGVGAIPQDELYTLTDVRGRLMVLRPDSTKPVARLVATRLKNARMPLKFYYNQCVYRRHKGNRLTPDEIPQCGVEYIGAGGTDADIETLLVAAEALKKTCGARFVLEIGHTALLRDMLSALNLPAHILAQVRRCVEAKNFPALAVLLDRAGSGAAFEAFKSLQKFTGGTEALDAAEALLGERAQKTTGELRRVVSALSEKGFADNLLIDLSLINDFDYYTGIVFKGYASGRGEAVLSGGRYDTLYGDYGLNIPAIGFAVNTDLLIREKAQTGAEKKRLTVALTKGRLEDFIMERLKAGGVDVSPVLNKGRKLVATVKAGDCGEIDVVFCKSADVITYVEHGVCDIGVTGKDTVMEQGQAFYEMMDLGFGKCRFALAAKAGADFFGGFGVKRIATKYPNVTRRFFEAKHMDVDIVKIDGSVELAPLLSLADGIVDIVETGSTLKANGLEVIEDIADISARLIVNMASYKMKKKGIEAFIALLGGGN